MIGNDDRGSGVCTLNVFGSVLGILLSIAELAARNQSLHLRRNRHGLPVQLEAGQRGEDLRVVT